MRKKIITLILVCVMIFTTGCGISSGTKDKLFGDSDVTNTVKNRNKW